MIKCVSLLRDEVAVGDGVSLNACSPRRVAVCTVRRPRDVTAVVLSWHDDPSDAERFATGLREAGPAETILVEERVAIGEEWLTRWRASSDEPVLVLVGFLQRAAHLTRDAFRDYWWEAHRPLANQLVPAELNPVAYVHNYVLDDPPVRWDGIGELYEASLDVASRRGQWFDSQAAQPLVDDEERFMMRATRQVLVTDARLVIDEQPG